MWSAGASHLRCFDWCPADPVLKSSFTCEQQCAVILAPTPSPSSQSPNLSIAQSTNHNCGSVCTAAPPRMCDSNVGFVRMGCGSGSCAKTDDMYVGVLRMRWWRGSDS